MNVQDNFALVQEIPYQNPLEVFAHFAHEPAALFLDSAKFECQFGRYSFIAVDPFLLLTSKNGKITLGDQREIGDPFSVLQQYLQKFPLNTHPNLPPFQGGVAGYFAYDLGRHLEKIPPAKLDDMQFPDLILGFYDVVLAFDQQAQRAWIFSSGYPELDIKQRQARAEMRCNFYTKKIATVAKSCVIKRDSFCTHNELKSNFTKEAYEVMVQNAIDYIFAGDIFQTNISQRFSAPFPVERSNFELYCKLRRYNPAAFAAYLNFGDIVIASASPERFLKLNHHTVEARPIKGTRPRGNNDQEDLRLRIELAESEKDKAENTMIVDLMRNDLSRVCCDHSVQVPQLCAIESFATVHHLVSVVEGQLKTDISAVDLLRATFPGGSITGAPKIRAMEIIAELEPTARGPYCGSIGYIGFDGTMDLSITIRSYVVKNKVVTFQVGGGVVADSTPQTEYEETLTKAAALQHVLIAMDDFL